MHGGLARRRMVGLSMIRPLDEDDPDSAGFADARIARGPHSLMRRVVVWDDYPKDRYFTYAVEEGSRITTDPPYLGESIALEEAE